MLPGAGGRGQGVVGSRVLVLLGSPGGLALLLVRLLVRRARLVERSPDRGGLGSGRPGLLLLLLRLVGPAVEVVLVLLSVVVVVVVVVVAMAGGGGAPLSLRGSGGRLPCRDSRLGGDVDPTVAVLPRGEVAQRPGNTRGEFPLIKTPHCTGGGGLKSIIVKTVGHVHQLEKEQ